VVNRPRVTVGRVVKAHGIRGEVVVEVLSDVPGRFDPGTQLRLGGVPTAVVTSRPHQGRLLVRFDGVADRAAAELLRGRSLEAEPGDTSDSDTYYVHELVGMVVLADDGRDLGEVSGHIELPVAAGYDLLEVTREDGTTWLLPAVDDYVEVAEADDGTELLVVVAPPEGLIDAPEGSDGPDHLEAPADRER
jgi:16S rRNA processing protein RimM